MEEQVLMDILCVGGGTLASASLLYAQFSKTSLRWVLWTGLDREDKQRRPEKLPEPRGMKGHWTGVLLLF